LALPTASSKKVSKEYARVATATGDNTSQIKMQLVVLLQF
jgi:hypothetical protein